MGRHTLLELHSDRDPIGGAASEDILEPLLPIIDPHHHLWDRPGSRYLLEEFLADAESGHNIRSTVFVECNSMYRMDCPEPMRAVGEAEFVSGIATMSASGEYGATRVCAGMAGFADLCAGNWVQKVLEAEIVASGKRLRSIRHSACWDPDATFGVPRMRAPKGLLAFEDFRAGFSKLAPLGLCFEAWQYFTQLPEVTDLARSYPGTTIVLDHVGGPVGVGSYAGRREEMFPIWQNSIRELAKCENVFVKLGGLGMTLCGFGFERRDIPMTSIELAQAWRPYIDTCIDAFGPDRCMFESNFPLDKASCSYQVLWNAFKRLAAAYSSSQKESLFSGTAARVYSLVTK